MISQVSIANFKGISSVNISLSKVNVFVGENGTGKSTVAHALAMLSKSLDTSSLDTNLPFINLGPLNKLVPPGEKGTITVKGVERVPSLLSHEVEYSLKVDFDSQGLYRYETKVSTPELNELSIVNTWDRYGPSTVTPGSLNIEGITYNLAPSGVIGEAFKPGGYAYPTPMTPEKESRARKIYELLTAISVVPALSLQKVRVVPILRGFLEPMYPLLPSISLEFNIRGIMFSVGSQVASALAYMDPQSKEKIQSWLKKIFNVRIDWRVEPGPQVSIFNADKDVYLVNEGFGINQTVFIFAELLGSKVVIVEEPEIHLHPKAQFLLGRLISEISVKEDVQVILNTHSENIVSGILHAVRSKTIKPEDATIWLFEKKEKGNTANRCSINEDGTTDEGLKTFIEASILELSDIIG
ncbi:hypothetical protein L3N51_01646 [Metallosphaera sp. J1]|uniref:AAA family ATPase n=1 Tax=Metallosphaera javensis (ex Hofmann et al. 2022) TaxID=99938 RepID=UPI002104A599|nr:AAA family ATPase [Metallosphaera javensis (ex Hofmann et al. 2022)]MCG3109356.1 hypothetical protein [Metallosphaera javensis (ex Hofmann et al. 2022)]